MRRGFKKAAEELARTTRLELQLSPYERLEPRDLAATLCIPIVGLHELHRFGAKQRSIEQFVRCTPADFSALTVFRGTARIIVVNPVHSEGRRNNSVAHELSHVLLEHEPAPAISTGGCRRWNQEMEDEADWLAGALLVPRKAAVRIAYREEPIAIAARRYGVSRELMTWRVNATGARRQARRGQEKRGGWRRR